MTGKPKNASLPLVTFTEGNDGEMVFLPEGGVGNFT